MKVILINSPIYNKKVADDEDYLPPFGLGYIATILKEKNIDIKIVDAVNENLTVNEILNLIKIEKPDFVGLNIFSINFELVQQIIENCDQYVKFIIGGKSTRFLYKDIIEFNTTNEIIVTIGEGEFITPDIVNNCVKELSIVNNIANRKVYKVDNNSIYFSQNISTLKLDRSFFNDRVIRNHYGEIEEAMVTSRECLYDCAFCGGARSLNKDVSVRSRSEDSIISELKYIESIHPETQSIRILDDLFLKNYNSIKSAINIFKNYNFNWRAMAHVNSFTNAFDLLPALRECGCQELEIGIESGNDDIRKKNNKIGNLSEVYATITKILKSGINVKGYFMYGLPNETIKECNDTYNFATKLYEYSKNTLGDFRCSAFQFRPYHGTKLYNEINENIKYRHDDSLNKLEGRKQFNFTAGNFSNCDQEIINDLIIKTNELGEKISYDKKSKIM